MDEALNMDAAYEGVRRLGLKEGNTAADRAKAMGFSNDRYFHGTTKDFNEFNPELHFADNFKTDYGFNLPTFLTNRTAISNMFSAGDNAKNLDGGKTLPAKFKGNMFDPSNKKHNEKIKEQLVNNKLEEIFGKKTKVKNVNDSFSLLDENTRIKFNSLPTDDTFGNIEHIPIQKAIQDAGFDGYITSELPNSRLKNKTVAVYNPANIRSQFAKFNPKKAGIGAGSIMSADLLAAPSGQPEFREAPKNLLDKILGYGADSYEYAANEGGLLGDILYSGGARALRNLEKGTTPMVKTGRLPAVPTGDALLDLMSLLQI